MNDENTCFSKDTSNQNVDEIANPFVTASLELHSLLNGDDTVKKIDILIPQNEEDIKRLVNPYQLKQISGGITNRIFMISHPETKSSHILRIYGQETNGLNIFDRESEIRSTVILSEIGLGPRVYVLFSNGRIEKYYEGDVMTGFDYRSDPKIYMAIATEIRRNHDASKVMIRSKDSTHDRKTENKWAVEMFLRRFRNIIKANEKSNTYLLTSYPNIDRDIEHVLSDITKQFTHHDVVGCHNDLHHGNMIIDRSKNVIKIIDFEYFGHNPFLYDICNYFNELCTFDCNWALYPNLSDRILFYNTYSGCRLTMAELREVDDKVMGLTKLNHLMWGMWGLAKHGLNVGDSAIDFDYLGYFHKRIGRFYQLFISK